MNTNIQQLSELIGENLAAFRVEVMTEVYRVNRRNQKCGSLGFHRDSLVAEAFVKNQQDPKEYRTSQALILTNGTVGFLLMDQTPVHFLHNDPEITSLRTALIDARLSALMPGQS